MFRFLESHSLVVISHENYIFPVALGNEDYLDDWSNTNGGPQYFIDKDSRITFTYVNGKGPEELTVTEKNIPHLERIEIDLLESFHGAS